MGWASAWKGSAMQCPFCGQDKDKVVDSRSSEGGRTVRRRRECQHCSRRYTTYERPEESVRLTVLKKDKSREAYQREKLIAGLQKACYKRPVSAEKIQDIADRIEEEIFRHTDKEVTSRFIGEKAMTFLRKVDNVAYIRFASVYRDFTDADDLLDEVSQAISQKEVGDQPKLFTE